MGNKSTIKLATFLSVIAFQIWYVFTGCANSQEHRTTATQQRFNDIQYWVQVFEDPERDKWQKPAEVVAAMNLRAGEVVADIGAGTGYFTRRFAVAVGPEGKALGLDIEQSMIDYMHEDARKLNLNNYEARVVKTDDPELDDNSVNVIFLCNTYHHITNRIAYFRNVSSSLKQQGRIIIVDFYKDSEFGPPRDHKLAKDIVLTEMSQAGYDLQKDLKILPQQYYLEFRVK